ncbi:MAG TPA: beta-propeller fold lactonase family protein [Pyrinomonadaceae bacterium]|nr:beta-propeller fold lactonase family protein [Pyrinomonadaceae bacterium]
MSLPTRVSSARRASLAFFVVLAAAVFGLMSSSADITVTNQPASEGRPITPAGSLVMDLTTRQPAVGALPVNFVRSPDKTGRDGRGRYLVAVNSGYGLQFNAASNRAQQSLSVIDLGAKPSPAVIENIYFPTPQSVNIGAAFSPVAEADGSFTLYASGGFENKIWMFRLRPGAPVPLTPTSPGPDTKVEAPFIDVSGFASSAPSPRFNDNRAPAYPAGVALSDDGNTLFVANNLGDSLGIVRDLNGSRTMTRVDLRREGSEQFMYPYAVVVTSGVETSRLKGINGTTGTVIHGIGKIKPSDAKTAYVSCWGDATVAVVNTDEPGSPVKFIPVARHPTAMVLNETRNRLYVVNSNADSVSVIDTETDSEVERINVRLSEDAPVGSSPEGLALSDDGGTLYVANAHSNSVAVVSLSPGAQGIALAPERSNVIDNRVILSRVFGFIPTGQYPSAIAVAGGTIFVGNGKGTGFENSSVVVNNSGRAPNLPNDRFPAGTGRGGGQGGQYSASLVVGNISAVAEPDERALARYTQQVMRNDGLVGAERRQLFGGRSPIKHVIYIIKENRTYDQVFGDIERSGDGTRADGDPSVAIFGVGDAARTQVGAAQNVTPNAHALSLRFGLFDRFFVNAEVSPDGHNWSTAAFSTDYLDKAYRWNYAGRGHGYDFEGFNRLPNISPQRDAPPLFGGDADAAQITNYMGRFVPYLRGARDVAEPETLYLWDAAARAGLTYRNYGEFAGTLSQSDVDSIRKNRPKSYPDTTPTVSVLPTKKTLEGHVSPTYRNFDLSTPDAMTVESYRAAKTSNGRTDALVSAKNADERSRGYSRVAAWLEEFRGFVADREAGHADSMPNLSVMRLPNDHTTGVAAGRPTPQFYVADNDYALGLIVEAVSSSPYWRDTAIFVVEDDAQDGPDHVDCHRSVALVVSAYNRAGALVHEFHNTVSLIRTIEMLLGLAPMNQLDASATPIDIFKSEPDLKPYKAVLPDISTDNLTTPNARDAAARYWMRRTAEQDLEHADMADARTLNEAIWFSVRGSRSPMPESARLPAFDAMRIGINTEAESEDAERDAGRNEVAESDERAGRVARAKPRRRSVKSE